MTALVPRVDPSSAVAVTSYLEQAKTWLATAVEQTGPEQIARAKAEIATAAEATKQLGLSKEIRDDASEMVRRAEWTVRKATQKAQEQGLVRTRRDGAAIRDKTFPSSEEKVSPSSFFTSAREYEDANAMADLDADQFEEVLTEARSEGNLSRTNVANKAREKAGKAKPTKSTATDAHRLAWLVDHLRPLTHTDFRDFDSLDDSLESEEAARLMGDLSKARTQLTRVINLLKERTK